MRAASPIFRQVVLLLGVSTACSDPQAEPQAYGVATASGGATATVVTGTSLSASTNNGGASSTTTASVAGVSTTGMPVVNEQPPPSLLGDVDFSVPSQAFQNPLVVSMSTAIAGAEIRYTTDRSVPTAASSLYSGAALTIAETTALRAQAFVDGAASGASSTALYVARDFDTSSDIPLMIVDGYGLDNPLDKDVYVDCIVMTFEPNGGDIALSALPSMALRAAYHVRGSSSATFPQKSYRIELRDNADADADYPLLGMPAEADWALVAPYRDRALIRNTFVYELGREMGLEAPQTRHAEVYLNYDDRPLRQSDYVGVYYVTETIKNAKNRLNLQQLRPEDTSLPAISGGYIMKFDWAVSEEPTLPCSGSGLNNTQEGGHCWADLEVVDPEPLGPEQATYLTDYVQAFHDALHAAPIGNYGSFIDLASFVDNFIVNELVKNLDEFTRSAYYYKDRDGLLVAGPLWDYNYSLDNGRSTNRDPEGWQYVQASIEPNYVRDGASDWYAKLFEDPTFFNQVALRWRELRSGVLSEASLHQRISDLASPLANSAPRDLERWPVREALAGDLGPQVESWEGQVQALKDWLSARLLWMDSQLM